MRIAIFHELDHGGARRVSDEFVKRLSKICDVDLYYIDNKEDKDIKKFPKKTFYYPFYPKTWKGKNWRIKLYKDTVELCRLYKLHLKIAKDIGSEKYDHILVNPSRYTQSPFLLRFLKNKCVYFCQEPLRMVYDPQVSDISGIKFPKNIYEFLNRKIRKWIDFKNLKNCSIILANSNYSKELIEKAYGKKAQVCYLGVDTNFFKPLKSNRPIDILFIGNKDEGYKMLMKSLKLFKSKPKIRFIFRDKKAKITDEELVKLYNSTKLLVALNQNEPFGLIPIEAMACGTPVIAVSEGGYRESIVDKKTGFLIFRDSKELYVKITGIIKDNKLRIRMSRNARENILQNWAWDKTVKSFLKIIKHEK